MKNIAYLILVVLTSGMVGCMSVAEKSQAQMENRKTDVTAEAEKQEGPKSLITVDGISIQKNLPKKYVIVAPAGKKTNLVFEQLKTKMETILKAQGYQKAEDPKSTGMVIVMDFAHNSREGQIALKAYDAQTTLKLQSPKTDQLKPENYKLLATTLIYYLNANKITFREAFPAVLETCKDDILKDLIQTKTYKNQ